MGRASLAFSLDFSKDHLLRCKGQILSQREGLSILLCCMEQHYKHKTHIGSTSRGSCFPSSSEILKIKMESIKNATLHPSMFLWNLTRGSKCPPHLYTKQSPGGKQACIKGFLATWTMLVIHIQNDLTAHFPLWSFKLQSWKVWGKRQQEPMCLKCN